MNRVEVKQKAYEFGLHGKAWTVANYMLFALSAEFISVYDHSAIYTSAINLNSGPHVYTKASVVDGDVISIQTYALEVILDTFNFGLVFGNMCVTTHF
ncbi:hypothetical protein STEG23_009192 [Scotinomys teguina]